MKKLKKKMIVTTEAVKAPLPHNEIRMAVEPGAHQAAQAWLGLGHLFGEKVDFGPAQ